MGKGKDTATGAATGATIGAVGGPWGAAAGGVIGGGLGYLGYMPGTGGGDASGAQSDQLGRNRAFTDALGAQSAANAGAYQPISIDMVGVPTELGVAAQGGSITMASPYGAPMPQPAPATAPPPPSRAYTGTSTVSRATPNGTISNHSGDIGLAATQGVRTSTTPASAAGGWTAPAVNPVAPAPATPAPTGGPQMAPQRSRQVQTPQYQTVDQYQKATGTDERSLRLKAPGTTIGPTQNAQAGTVTAPKPVEAGTAQAGTATARTTQTAQTADSRGRLVDAISITQNAVDGNAPSAADRTGALLADKAAARARGMAASLQGRSVGGALTQAQQTGAAAQADIAAQAMANRANEIAVARGQLNEAVGTLRAGDTSQATTDATLGTQASVTNANNTTTTNVSNARAGEQVGIANAGNELTAGVTNANNTTSTNVSNADRDARTGIAQGQITSTEAVAAQDRASKEALALSQLQLQAQQGNQDAKIRLQALADARARGDQDAYLRALGIETSLVSGIDATNQADKASGNQFIGGLISTGGQIYAANGAGGGRTGTTTNYGDGTMPYKG